MGQKCNEQHDGMSRNGFNNLPHMKLFVTSIDVKSTQEDLHLLIINKLCVYIGLSSPARLGLQCVGSVDTHWWRGVRFVFQRCTHSVSLMVLG